MPCFAGFTSDGTFLVWVGYDNARGKQTPSHGGIGGAVPEPIAQAIIIEAAIFPSRRAQEAARHSRCTGKGAFTRAGWASGRSGRGYHGKVLSSGRVMGRAQVTHPIRSIQPDAADIAGTDSVLKECESGYINRPPFSGNIVGITEELG
jgi:membrane peptidoglycan carboxypeptidase